ncbi:hypothetical protein AB0C51_03805 [Streptomyces pathocidini]|uniref:hypothetical protein n=1 Tax=Streptomyces pathocidini TaxID=1650571 RepID=UPI0033E78471
MAGPDVLNPADGGAGVSPNATAQYGLATIQNVALIGDNVPAGVARRRPDSRAPKPEKGAPALAW